MAWGSQWVTVSSTASSLRQYLRRARKNKKSELPPMDLSTKHCLRNQDLAWKSTSPNGQLWDNRGYQSYTIRAARQRCATRHGDLISVQIINSSLFCVCGGFHCSCHTKMGGGEGGRDKHANNTTHFVSCRARVSKCRADLKQAQHARAQPAWLPMTAVRQSWDRPSHGSSFIYFFLSRCRFQMCRSELKNKINSG